MTHPDEPLRPSDNLDMPDLLTSDIRVCLVDVVAYARMLHGDEADCDCVVGLPDHDYRWRIIFDYGTGAGITFHAGATAEYVIQYIDREKEATT